MNETNNMTTTQLTDAEKAFLSMVKLAGIKIETSRNDYRVEGPVHGYWIFFDPVKGIAVTLAKLIEVQELPFPIVASTFAQLVEERPELRPHYDAAKAAWEASQ